MTSTMAEKAKPSKFESDSPRIVSKKGQESKSGSSRVDDVDFNWRIRRETILPDEDNLYLLQFTLAA